MLLSRCRAMHMLDPVTLIAMVVVLGVILGLCLIGLRRTLPASILGLYPWACSLLALAAGALAAFLASQGVIDHDWLVLAGFAYVGGWIGIVLSIRRFVGRTTPTRWLVVAFALAALPGVVLLLWPTPAAWPQLWLLCVMLLCSIVGLESLLRSEQARESLGGRLLIFAFSAQTLSAVVRISLVLTTNAPSGWLQSQSSTHAQLGLVYASAALLIGSIGLMLMATDRLRRMLEHLATHDGLTGLLERTGFRIPAEHSLALARRRDEPVACLLCDIDEFKQVNDRYGHPAGDAVLVRVAGLLSNAARASDLVARYGGEEFVMLLPNCNDADAIRFAERVRLTVADALSTQGAGDIAVTLSIGIAVGRGEDLQMDALYRRADRALYAAKHGGRNRVCISPRSRTGSGN
jgi:diguanylate cyclase (GGDEF)-like protein